MSNKQLAYSLLAAVVIIAAGFVWWKLKLKKQEEPFVSTANIQKEMENQKIPEAKPAEGESVKTAQCERKFSAETLKNAKVSTKGRQVEMNVNGFGKIVLEFYDKDAPKTVENFLRLANSGYFDCLTFHRIAKGFVIQGGDPTGTGTGGDSAFGGEFADEINPESALYKTGYQKGVLAMANRGPNTNTSQFFIMLGDVPLPPSYTIFGKVSAGIDIVEKIGQVEINPGLGPTDGSPKQPVIIESVKITK